MTLRREEGPVGQTGLTFEQLGKEYRSYQVELPHQICDRLEKLVERALSARQVGAKVLFSGATPTESLPQHGEDRLSVLVSRFRKGQRIASRKKGFVLMGFNYREVKYIIEMALNNGSKVNPIETVTQGAAFLIRDPLRIREDRIAALRLYDAYIRSGGLEKESLRETLLQSIQKKRR